MSKLLSYSIGCLLLIFTSSACKANKKACSIPKASVKQEIKKWKAELLINGEVGPPCKKRYDIWIEENPNYYYGMQPVKELSSDLNEDGTEELLCYFPAVNCVGGNGTDSDFAMFLFHKDSMLLTNKRISLQIEEYIEATIYSNRLGEKTIEITDVNIDVLSLHSFVYEIDKTQLKIDEENLALSEKVVNDLIKRDDEIINPTNNPNQTPGAPNPKVIALK